MSETSQKPILYLIICAAPPAQHMHDILSLLQEAGWDVYVIATPQASLWIERERLATLSGHIVRTEYKRPGEADPFPKAHAVLVMPATFNTINKCAQGISDTLATSLLCEHLGRKTSPMVFVPCLKIDLVNHPAFVNSLRVLRACGATILHEPERYPSPAMVPWECIISALPCGM